MLHLRRLALHSFRRAAQPAVGHRFARPLAAGGLLALGAGAAAFALAPAARVECDDAHADGGAEARFQQQQLVLWLAHARARAESLLSEPPAGLARFGADWRELAGAQLAGAFDARRAELRAALAAVRASGGGAALEQLDALAEAINRAEEAMRKAREGARSRQTPSSWSELIRDAPLVRLGGRGAPVRAADELAGKTVLLYFTAGWCAPCREFTPRLMAAARALDAASGGRVEVVQVSWDHDALGFQKYADALGMRWLALPHAERETARALSQRFEVATIPALVVLAVSADGQSAQLVSADGRADVERFCAAGAGAGGASAAQHAPWVRQLLNGR